MKKIFSLLAAVLFAGSMMAETSTLTFTQACGGAGTASDGVAWTVTSDATESSYDSNKGIHYGTGSVAVSYLTLSTSGIQGTITKVVVNASGASGQSPKVNVSVGGAGFGSEATASSTAANYTFEGSAEGAIVVTISQPSAKKALYCKSIEVTYTVPAGTVATPLISGEAEFTESTTVTITCSTEGAVLYYTLDGTEPNNSATAYSAPFNLTETATVKAIAYNQSGDQTSAVASKTFTKKEPLVAISCAEVYSKAKNDEIALNKVVVTYVNGKNVYVKDESGAMLLYLPSNSAWVAGDTLAGVEGKLDIYNGLYEVKPTAAQVTAVAATHGEAPAAIEFATVPVAADMNKYIVMKDVKVDTITFRSNKNINATIGDQTFVLRNNFNANMTFDTAKVYDITGAVAVYNSTVQVYFIKAETEGGETPVVPGDTILPDPTNCAEAAAAALSVSANNELYNNGAEYTIEGYVTSIAYAWKAGTMTFWMADSINGGNVLEAYKCAVDSANAPKVTDKVRVTGKLTKYNTTPEFAEGCTVVIVEVGPGLPDVDIDVKDCASAAEAALSVSANNEYYKDGQEFTVDGYVTSIQTPWADGKITFWMADTQDGGNVLEAYKCAIANQADAPNMGYKVRVTGKLTKYNTTPEFAEGCTCEILERAADPINLGVKTIAEFLALKNTKDTCILTGVIANLPEDKTAAAWKYGNFDLVDGTDSLYVYGLLTPDGRSQQFASMGLENGSEITILAVYNEYEGKPQAKNAVLVPEEVEMDTINVATAVNLALELEDNAESLKDYVVMGYVANIDVPYSSQYGNITFYMSDDATATYGDLKIHRGSISAEEGAALAHGDRVMVVGKLKNNFFSDQNSAQMAAGAKVSVMWKQAIEHIVLTEKVNKVIMDGVLYIVRDGKLYNIQGAQVR